MATTVKVKKGDTLSAIAAKAGITLAALIKLNPQIKNPNLINPGQVITTSKATPATPAAPTPTPVPAGDPSARGATAPIDAAKAYALGEPQRRDIAAAKINADPDVIAARKNAAEAAEAVKKAAADKLAAEKALAETRAFNSANKLTPDNKPASSDYVTIDGILNFKGAPFNGQYNGKYYTDGKAVEPKGAAWTWDGKTWVKPKMPDDGKSYTWNDDKGWQIATTADVVSESSGIIIEGNDAVLEVIPPSPGDAYIYDATTKTWVRPPRPEGPGYSWDDNDGWFITTVAPGSTAGIVGEPERMNALDTFKNTFALMFGAQEANQPYVSKLYSLVSNFYKTGSNQEEAMNLAIRQAFNENAIPEFTKRFAGIFALDVRLKAGEAIAVPTIAEFFATEAKMGEVLNAAGLGELATQEFLGQVIGLNKSVNEVTLLINNTFESIDNAPKSLKDTLSRFYPSIDRVSLAKAILQGPEGAAALDKKIKGISVLSASETQGVGTSLEQASDIAAMGYGYTQALTGFGEVNKLKRAGELAQISGTKFTQDQAQDAVFGKNAKELAEIERLKQLEENRFSNKSGTMGSKSFASQTRGSLY